MIELKIPGLGLIELEHLVCDVDGTLAVDGKLQDGLVRGLSVLKDRLSLHLLTADTHGKQEIIDRQLNLQAVQIQPGEEARQKADYVHRLGAESVVALGHGANDAAMLKEARLGICVFSPEGAPPARASGFGWISGGADGGQERSGASGAAPGRLPCSGTGSAPPWPLPPARWGGG